jgi:MATE family multidrug resistance protein
MPSTRTLSHKQVWTLAWPLMLSNLTTPLMGLADTAMLGHLGSPLYLAAAAIGANVLTFSLWIFGFLRMGTTSLTGQALGAGQHQQIKQLLYRGWLLGSLLGLALIILQFLLLPQILKLMTPDSQVRQFALSYCLIRLSAAPAVLMTYAAVGWFIGLQQTRAPLLIALTVNCLNLLLDWWLILVLGWGSDGAALASACAEYAGLALAVTLVIRQLKRSKSGDGDVGPSSSWLFRGWVPLLRINGDLFIRTASLLGVFSFFTAQGAHMGPATVAANAILLQLLLLASHGLDGYAHAAEAMVAKTLGSRDSGGFIRACFATGIASILLAGLMTFFFLLARTPLIALLTDIPELRQHLHTYYFWLAILPLVSVWSYLFDGIFIGAGHTRSLRNWMLFAAALVFLPLWWLSQSWHNHGLWLAFTAFNLARGLSLAALFCLHWRLWFQAEST